MIPILTERLILRDWRPEDRPAFAAMNADPRVMHFLRGPMSAADADSMIDRFTAEIVREGLGIFAVEEAVSGRLVGMIGLHRIRPSIPIAPAVEVAWRLAADTWGQGYASEGARACLAFGFDEIGLPEIVAYATAPHAASRRVMEKIGLRRSAADDFDHPELPMDDPFRRHVVYRLRAEDWRGDQPGRG
ncbi:MAG: GNAT family N-acetyltransferase [Bauldia sp.]